MGSSAEAKAIAHDLVAPSVFADEIEIGQLFGGAALRMEGVVVAVVIDEVFYLVVDDGMRQ
jgi:TfoX/Sxy family transcriptional regulator of competence genes